MSAENSFICCFCGKTFIGWGNDPWPINNDSDAQCCDLCNLQMVLPARIKAATKESLNNRTNSEN